MTVMHIVIVKKVYKKTVKRQPNAIECGISFLFYDLSVTLDLNVGLI